MNLKPEDCVRNSQSGLGVAPVSVIASLSLLIGLVLGFVARPFFTDREISGNRFISRTWRHYQASLRRIAVIACSAIRSGVASSALYDLALRSVNLALCHLSVVFRNIRLARNVQYDSKKTPARNNCEESVSLFQPDIRSDFSGEKLQVFAGQVKDLISFDEGADVLEMNVACEEKSKRGADSKVSSCKIEDMINNNLSDFASKPSGELRAEELAAYGPVLVQRRPRGAGGP